MVDGVHFRSEQLTRRRDRPSRAGRRAVGPGSDGSRPRRGLPALGLPRGQDPAAVLDVARGAQSLAADHGVVDRRRRHHRGERADRLVHGRRMDRGPGRARRARWRPARGSSGGYRPARRRRGGAGRCSMGAPASRARSPGRCAARYARPEPRFAAGQRLAGLGARAMIDISDGLATDAGHIAAASGVRLELSLAPVAARRRGRRGGRAARRGRRSASRPRRARTTSCAPASRRRRR